MMTPLEAQLTQQVEAQRQQIAELSAQLAAERQENKLQREKIDLLIKRIFGKSSEKLDDAQLLLMLQGDEERKKDPASCASPGALEAEIERRDKAAKAAEPRQPKLREPRLPEHLPAVDEVIEPDEVKADPAAWRYVNAEVTEQLDYQPARYFRRRIIRKKYVKRDEPHQAPVIAPLHTLQERSIAGPGLLAHIIVSKYCDHLPLYRQQQIAKLRHQIDLPRQSMARHLALAATWLEPIYEMIRTGVMAGGYMQGDETTVEYLEPGNGQTCQGYFWTFNRPRVDAFFVWRTSRGAGCLHNIIPADFTGTLQCDGYGAYPAFARQREAKLTLAGCWAHVRRKFVEAKGGAHRAFILLQIRELYHIERRLREAKAGPSLRQAVRAAESRVIVERIHRLLIKLKRGLHYLPRSAMGQAIEYTLTLWSMLLVFLNDGRIEIDNNQVENAIRPTAVGKKNWLFIGEADAGQRSAILYTVIEACRRRSIDPFDYLRDVFTRMPAMAARDYGQLLPAAWAKARDAKSPGRSICTTGAVKCCA